MGGEVKIVLLSHYMKLLVAISILATLAFAAFIYIDVSGQPAAVVVSTYETSAEEEVVISVTKTDQGYEPDELVIDQGDTVLFVNESEDYAWPVSDPYPTGEYYPEFNPERSIPPGGSWKFTFNKAGEWGFHDHIQPTFQGEIVAVDENEQAFDLKEGQVFEEVVE